MSRTRVAHGDARTVQRRTTSESAQTTYSPVGKAASFPHSTHNISTNTRVNEMARIGAQKTSASTFRESSQPDLSSQYQCSVCSASLDPPITRETLSELDWDRISSNLLLRHDLNFEPNIQYRPNTHGARGIERSLENVHYWDAVTVEVDTFLTRKEKMFTSRSQKCLRTPLLSSEPLRSCHSILLRLPRMFGAIRETLKTLVPDREWPAVDSRLDVDLLVQQMENRACDFISLGDCLASLLRRFCSPERDHLFDDMTAKIQLGVRQANAQLIVHGLRRAFSILEIMRLDFANHQIQSLRLSAVNSTVGFEQQDFLRRVAEGWDPTAAYVWLSKEQQVRRSISGSGAFIAAVTDLIVQDVDSLPPTFTLDYVRLRTMQADFLSLKFRLCCLRTFQTTLKMLKWDGAVPQRSYDGLFARLSVLISNETIQTDHSSRLGDAALEIGREAYKISKITKIPSADHLEFAEKLLNDSCDRNNNVFADLESSLGNQLHKLVEYEVDTIGNLTPVQIINHYGSSASINALSKEVNEQTELLRIARRLAHIAVLHWRIWAPIIYKQPVGPRFQEGSVSYERHSNKATNPARSLSDNEQTMRRGSTVADRNDIRGEEC